MTMMNAGCSVCESATSGMCLIVSMPEGKCSGVYLAFRFGRDQNVFTLHELLNFFRGYLLREC